LALYKYLIDIDIDIDRANDGVVCMIGAWYKTMLNHCLEWLTD